jgi:hypothetical protein
MVRTQVYLTREQARDIKLRARREQKREAEVIRELLSEGLSLFCHTGIKPWKLFIMVVKLRKPCCKEGSAKTASHRAKRQENTAG